MRLLPLALCLVLTACVSTGAKPPVTFVQSTSESRNTVVIDVRDGLNHATAMRTLTDVLALHSTVEITDPHAGFAMTAWAASSSHDGVPDIRYRTRFVAQFLGDDWRQLSLRHEANWSHGAEWDIGYDSAQLDTMSAELRLRLGRHP